MFFRKSAMFDLKYWQIKKKEESALFIRYTSFEISSFLNLIMMMIIVTERRKKNAVNESFHVVSEQFTGINKY